MEIDQFGTSAEVDLGSLTWREVENNRGFGLIIGQGLYKPPHCGIAAGEAVVAHQSVVDGGAVNPFGYPGENLLSIGRHRGVAPRLLRSLSEDLNKFRLGGQGPARVKPTMRYRLFTYFSGFTSPNDTCPGKIAIRLAGTHVKKNLLILEHLEPPIGHGRLLHKKWKG